MWAVHNLADRFGDEYDFFVVTRDCDGKLDQTPFTQVPRNTWVERPEANVYYASPSNLNRGVIESLVNEVSPDLIYLNSVFSYVCAKLLLTRRRSGFNKVPLLLAPCGEFAVAALNIKAAKKRSFLAFAKVARLFEGVIWKASSESEKREITDVAGISSPVMIASELPPKELLPDFSIDQKPFKANGGVKLIYLSNVTPKKNLLFLLELLEMLPGSAIRLDVIGPSNDELYLDRCIRKASELPSTIEVKFHGPMRFNSGLDELIRSHFMILPTLNENFGYVVIEALAAGCPVITSDQIPWESSTDQALIRKIGLSDREAWIDAINECISMDDQKFRTLSFSARKYAVEWLAANRSGEDFDRMLKFALAYKRE